MRFLKKWSLEFSVVKMSGLSLWVVTFLPVLPSWATRQRKLYTKDYYLGKRCICVEEMINELPGGEDEVLGEPESVLTFMCETNVFVCGFTSRMEEEQERQCKGMGPELDKVGGLWNLL